jgi:carbon storage regulator CsrA
MLVLTRKQEEQIRIGDQIVVTVLRIKGNTVKIGIDAPRSIRVIRTELPVEENAAAEGAAEQSTQAADATIAPVAMVRKVGRKARTAPLGRFEAVISQAIAK